MFRSLTNIMQKISSNHRLKKYFIYDKIKEIWENNIDKQIQKNARIINFTNNIIIIQTATPTWKTELGFQKTELLNIINNNLQPNQLIKDIKFI